MSVQPKVIAAFDFDGTLTHGDTLFSFLRFTTGTSKTMLLLAAKLPLLVGYLFGKSSRQSTKEKVLKAFYSGMPLKTLQLLGEQFATQHLDSHLKPHAMERVRWHLSQGHRCILISASIDVYLDPWAKKHGFNDVICSEVESDSQGNVTGLLKGENCWGPEKTRRLEALLGPRDEYTLYAYGNSRGDQELLAMADHSFYRKFT